MRFGPMPMNRYTVGGGFMEQFIKLLTLDVIIRLSSYLIAAIVLSILYGGIINRLLKINQGKKKTKRYIDSCPTSGRI
jgi:hypothetical protein